MNNWIKFSSINFDLYDLPEDICSGDWYYLMNDLKEEYAAIKGWDKSEDGEDVLWDEDNDKLYEAECRAYEIIAELREERGYK